MSKNTRTSTLTAPVLSESEGSALAALLTYTDSPVPKDVVAETDAGAALVRVVEARDALTDALAASLHGTGGARWGMTVAIFAAVEAGATRTAIGESAGINNTVVGHYARFPGRLAIMADALGIDRPAIHNDSALTEAVWSFGGRLSDAKYAALAEAVTGLVANDDADVTSWEYVAMAASVIGQKAGSRKIEADAEPVTDDNGVELTTREAALVEAVAFILSVHADTEATDAERAAIAGLVASLA